jgi:hypothetical protein
MIIMLKNHIGGHFCEDAIRRDGHGIFKAVVRP